MDLNFLFSLSFSFLTLGRCVKTEIPFLKGLDKGENEASGKDELMPRAEHNIGIQLKNISFDSIFEKKYHRGANTYVP